MRKRTTIADVARQARVNRSTVSRALRNDPRISSETVRKISAIARRIEYSPHVAARNLALGRTDTISAIVPGLISFFCQQVLIGVEQEIIKTKYRLMIDNAYHLRVDSGIIGMKDPAPGIIRSIVQGHTADGMIIISMGFPDRATEEYLRKSDYPVVMVEGRSDWAYRVTLDNVKAGHMAAEHLIRQGRRKLAIVTGDRGRIYSMRQRCDGFMRAVRASGKRMKAPVLIEFEHQLMSVIGPTIEKLLRYKDLDGVFFAAGDPYALEAMKIARRHGVKIPEDWALIGVDGMPEAATAGLTTIEQPLQEYGRRAVDILVKVLAGQEKTLAREWVAAPRLIIRNTA